jgi:hypothetical protein
VRPDRVKVVSLNVDAADPAEEPNLNTGTPWSSWDDQDIRWQLDHNNSIEEVVSRFEM